MRALTGVMVLMAGVNLGSGSVAGEQLLFDCQPATAKVGDIDFVCALFERRLAAAFPGNTVHRSAEADMKLIVEVAAPQRFVARIDQRGRSPGEAQGVARRDADLDDKARSDLIDALLTAMSR